VIDLPFDPTLTLGPIRASWHALFSLVAMIVGAAVGIRLGRPHFSADQGWTIAMGGIAGGLIGARIFHVFDSWPQYAADPIQVLVVWNGGSSIVGGIMGGFAGAVITLRRIGVRPGHVLDVGAVGLGTGMAVGRIGDVISGEHHATACAGLPWCVRYTNANTLGQATPVHPAVVYEMIWDLLAVVALLWLLPRAARLRLEGRLFFVFVGIYGVGRLLLSATRADPEMLFGLQAAQLGAIAFIAIGAAALLTRRPHVS
jgi:phosphatidylglycerol:prolipoprotein diacylglycerol transferase